GTPTPGRRLPQGGQCLPGRRRSGGAGGGEARLTPRLLEQRCDRPGGTRARQLAPSSIVCSAAERAVLPLHYRYSIAQIELATDVVFQRTAPLRALFRRATELGVLLGGADRTTHLFGRRITHHYEGELQTVLDRRNEGQPILRCCYGSAFGTTDE